MQKEAVKFMHNARQIRKAKSLMDGSAPSAAQEMKWRIRFVGGVLKTK